MRRGFLRSFFVGLTMVATTALAQQPPVLNFRGETVSVVPLTSLEQQMTHFVMSRQRAEYLQLAARIFRELINDPANLIFFDPNFQLSPELEGPGDVLMVYSDFEEALSTELLALLASSPVSTGQEPFPYRGSGSAEIPEVDAAQTADLTNLTTLIRSLWHGGFPENQTLFFERDDRQKLTIAIQMVELMVLRQINRNTWRLEP